MKFSNHLIRLSLIFFLVNLVLNAQQEEKKIIKIIQAGSSTQNELKFPGANILTKIANTRVHLFHEGALIRSDISYFYPKRNFFTAKGNVIFTQGDSLRMTCDYIEYDGEKKIAFARGSVFLERPDMTLNTDSLKLDRSKSKAYYETGGTIRDEETKLTSRTGVYFIDQKKYRFVDRVNLYDPEYSMQSRKLDYFTELNKAFFEGKTKIIGQDYLILCEKGNYNTKLQKGSFQKNAIIFYDNKEIEGDSLFFEKEKNYASATNNVKITDTLNKSIINGHFGEIFKSKDSAIITKRAISINILENDSLYIHADTLIALGDEKNRKIKAFYDVRIFKSDIRGKSDSLIYNEKSGIIKLFKKPLTKKQLRSLTKSQKNKKNPILWFGQNQMSGDTIFMISNVITRKLDSLKIIGNVMVVEKDSLSNEGFNQIKGGILNGMFSEGKLKDVEIKKNIDVIYYMYSEENNELIGINKTTCSKLFMQLSENEIKDISFFIEPLGKVYPDKELPINERKLEGFIWRSDEKPETINDLFSQEDLNIKLPKIHGIKE